MADPNPELDTLIDGFSRAAFHGNAAWFLGAGVSRPSKLVGWADLMRPLARELGITLDANHDDLPAIAQYYINNSSGNRGPLIQHIRHILDRHVEPSVYHREIARSSIGTIWTTNYDSLMDQALAGLKHRVRVRESDMVELIEPGTIEVIKAHGSFGVSKPSEFVVATEDYEDYAQNRPATTGRLQNNLLSKSFLFVGYAYGDPNIRAILVEARRLAERATLSHWMLTTASDGKDVEAARRQQLWKTDLNRIGIKCVLMKTYEEVEKAVSRIATRSRGATVYVTGSHTKTDDLAAEVGGLLADPDHAIILLDGQSSGISRSLLSSFQAACINRRIDLNERLRFFPNPYAADPRFSMDPTLLPLLKQWRRYMLRQAHSVIAFDGGMGTEAEVEIAMELGCCIIPVPRSNSGLPYALLGNSVIAADLERRSPGYLEKAKKLALAAEDVLKCVLEDIPLWPR